MKQFEARVRSNSVVARDYFEMEISWPVGLEAPLPGQFLSIKSIGTSDLILRRPFAVAGFRKERNTATIIYQRRGKATSMLAAKLSGEALDVIGPLGNSFPAESERGFVLVGGGVGLGPVLFFGTWLAERGRDPTVVLGFRDEGYVPSLLGSPGSKGDRAPLGFNPVVCTDDGSRGFRGTTVGWLQSAADEQPERFRGATVHACGPNAMMAACSRFCKAHEVPCWVSMEQIMGCGVGACVGCAIPVTDGAGFARVCTEGPIFDSRLIAWEQLQ